MMECGKALLIAKEHCTALSAVASQYDQLNVGGSFTVGGAPDLNVSYSATAGDTFQIFTSGGFDSGSFAITTNLAGGLTWNTTSLASTGVVSIVPEPSTWALLSLGLVALSMFAQRYRRAGLPKVVPPFEKR